MKPLGIKAYGSVPHLPGSRRGPTDKGLTEEQASILTDQCRPGDRIIVTEKLDGSNTAVAKVRGQIIPLVRAGYRAASSKYEQHHLFEDWVMRRQSLFMDLLEEGERACGEWLAQVLIPLNLDMQYTRTWTAIPREGGYAEGVRRRSFSN